MSTNLRGADLLEQHMDTIIEMLQEGTSTTALANKYNVALPTMRRFLINTFPDQLTFRRGRNGGVFFTNSLTSNGD